MQQNLEHSVPSQTSSGLKKADGCVPQAKGIEDVLSLHVAEVVDELQQPCKENRQGRKHSPVMRYLSLVTGDGSLLVAVLSLVLVLSSPLHLELRVSGYTFGTWNTKFLYISLAIISWAVASKITQSYELLNALNRFRSSLSVVISLSLALILWMVLTIPFFISDLNSLVKFALLFFIMAMPILCIWRVLFAEVIGSPRFRRQAVIVGTSPAGISIAKEIRHTKHPYATILGFICENTEAKVQIDGVSILGGRKILHHLGNSGKIDMIITALDYDMYPELFQEVIEMAQLGISIVPMPLAYEYASGKVPVEHMRDQWYLALPLKMTVSPLYYCWSKVMDSIFGLFGTIILLMFLPILTILIYLDSPGPIFYRQERTGMNGKAFRIFKFRSMCIDAEQGGHAIWATDDDPRITRFGRFMRKIHLDELPQVLNILCGDMSLIGPRPEREEFNTQLEKAIPFYRCRLTVKPGLTGWAQVKYHYVNNDNDALIKLQYDLYYIKHQSFTLDILILLKTVIEVLMHHGT